MNIFGRLSKTKDNLKKHMKNIMYYSKLAGLGSLGSLFIYAATRVEEHELSYVGKLVGGGKFFCSPGIWMDGGICSGGAPKRIVTLAEAMQRMQFDYSVIGVVLGFTAVGTYLVVRESLKNKRGYKS